MSVPRWVEAEFKVSKNYHIPMQYQREAYIMIIAPALTAETVSPDAS
jgi:hypothetical protein